MPRTPRRFPESDAHMMQFIRSKGGKFIVIPIVVAFIAWMVLELGMQATGAGTPGDMGSVNGEKITVEAYRSAVEAMNQRAQEQNDGKSPTPEQQRVIRESAWEQLVTDALIRQEMERRRIGVTDREITIAATTLPHPQLAQQEIFQTNGQFDIAKYRNFLAGPQASDEMLGELEGYYREMLPRRKLESQLSAGARVTDAELWRAFQDQNEKATVELISLDLSRLAPGEVKVSDSEVRSYYDANPDRFERPRTARLTVAYLSKATTPADRAAALQNALRIRQEIAGGGDFAAIAKRESQDPGSAANGGDLGTFTRGQMVGAFDSAAAALPIGELSQPVETSFGYHLIQVTARGGDQITARHILLPIGRSEAEQAKLDARADSLPLLTERRDIAFAARAVGATLRRGVTLTESLPVIPGVGQAQEALDWAASAAPPENGKPAWSDVYENENTMYMVQLESYQPKGRMSLAEAKPQITRDLILKRKREQARKVGEQMVAELRAGKSMQQVAAARGLTVQVTGPFARIEPNPVLGQANAAIGAAFGTPVGQVSNVVESTAGLFILRPTQRVGADRAVFQAQREQQRMGVTQQMQQGMVQRWLASARENAKIVDNREKLGVI